MGIQNCVLLEAQNCEGCLYEGYDSKSGCYVCRNLFLTRPDQKRLDAWKRIVKYMEDRGYSFSYSLLCHEYNANYKNGQIYSIAIMHIFRERSEDCELAFGSGWEGE